MKIFMFYCLLFIHVNMCIYIMYIFVESTYCYYYVDIESGYPWVWFWRGVITGLVFGSVLGFDFKFWVRVHIDFIRSEPAPIATLTFPRDGPGGAYGCNFTCLVHVSRLVSPYTNHCYGLWAHKSNLSYGLKFRSHSSTEICLSPSEARPTQIFSVHATLSCLPNSPSPPLVDFVLFPFFFAPKLLAQNTPL